MNHISCFICYCHLGNFWLHLCCCCGVAEKNEELVVVVVVCVGGGDHVVIVVMVLVHVQLYLLQVNVKALSVVLDAGFGYF